MEPKTAVVSSGMSYAQGVLAYELLTGVHPFYTSSRTKMLSNIRSAESCRHGRVSQTGWYPMRHGIPHSMVSRSGMVSHAAWYPAFCHVAHNIPPGVVSPVSHAAPSRRALIMAQSESVSSTLGPRRILSGLYGACCTPWCGAGVRASSMRSSCRRLPSRLSRGCSHAMWCGLRCA